MIKDFRQKLPFRLLVAAIFLGLYEVSLYNYLLFHTLVELFSIVIAGTIFIIAWNGRHYIRNSYLLIIGIAYLFIGFLDLLHTLSYTGMNIFPSEEFFANQLWVIARGMEALSLLFAFVFAGRETLPLRRVAAAYLVITAAGIWSVFISKIFPACYVAGAGQTTFKLVAEIVIIFILLITFILLIKRREDFTDKIFRLMISSLVMTMLAELAFTIYISNYGISNLLGHFFKVGSFYFIYKALIETGFNEPVQFFFRQLEENRQDLEESNRVKDRFFSIIAHDLRSPISGLLGLTANMSQFFTDMSDRDQKEFISEMHKAVKEVYNLLENLLSWSRLQTKRIEVKPETFTAGELMKEVRDLLSPRAKLKEITITLPEKHGETPLKADMNMIRTCLRNLVSNAIKFTPRGGTISLGIEEEGPLVSLMVADNGIGLSPDDFRKILNSDRKFSTRGTEDERGTGLGLILTREFLALNKGQLDARETPGGGTTFILTLPQE